MRCAYQSGLVYWFGGEYSDSSLQHFLIGSFLTHVRSSVFSRPPEKMSVGLLVDFIMHVLLRYYESSGNRKEKTINTLKTMGSSIFLGGASSLLGTLPLAFSTSEMFFNIFIVFFGLVVMGTSHGLILLPVILSSVGPEDPPVNRQSVMVRDKHAAAARAALELKGEDSSTE